MSETNPREPIWWTRWDPVPVRPWCLVNHKGRRLRTDRFETIRFKAGAAAIRHAEKLGLTLALRDGEVIKEGGVG